MAEANKDYVSTGKPAASGAIFVGERGKNLPTDAKTTVNAAYMKLGYLSEDGIANSVSTESESIKAFGGDTVLVVNTGREETFKFTLIQSADPDVLKTVYGTANVTTTSDLTTVKHNALEREVKTWVFDVLMTGNRKKRIVVPAGKITEVGDVVYKDGEAIGYECTVTAFPDAEGNTATEYISVLSA